MRAQIRRRLADRIVSCQRFGPTGAASRFFEVTLPPMAEDRERGGGSSHGAAEPASLIGPTTEAEFVRAYVDQALQQGRAAAEIQDGQMPETKHPSEVSPWLELTRWAQYLRGQDLAAVAQLGSPPEPSTEPLLVAIATSVARLVDRAYGSIRDFRINEFDQVQINCFLRKPGVWNRPIQIQLRPSTYRQYCQVWQRLICFAYRSSRPGQTVQLRHCLTTAQMTALDTIEEYANQCLGLESEWGALGGATNRGTDTPGDKHPTRANPPDSTPSHPAYQQLDQACLTLSIALLDHTLKGDLYESTLVGFLAVLGVDAEKKTFRDPYYYTTYLSGLVKIAQMLVAEQAVQMADQGHVTHPADALEEMRERFLMFGVRAPFGWIARLRAYGKRIQNTTTSLGYISWSDDEQTLSYRDLQFSMDGFQQFIRTEVTLAQAELEQLFLLHPEDRREDVVPQLVLHSLQDDPTNYRRGWSFLQDRRNREALTTTTPRGERDLGGGERWLLNRVLSHAWLREEFVEARMVGPDQKVLWHKEVVEEYLQQGEKFLQRLLLLVHLTSGQPARATELLSLRHSNTVYGRHRNIFIEHGLVSTVTTYHKGYSVSNSTKIIHRYLPKVVSELVVYYLWLILPFRQSLEQLVYGHKESPSPFLWPAGDGCWDSVQLRKVLEREAKMHLHTKMNILSYRHAAIAISRVHLKCKGFKRDYGTDESTFDEQASHGAWMAGTVYARGLQEAPGHIEARRQRYRAISREWHQFLGFEVYRGVQKRRACDDLENGQQKRPYIVVEMGID
jgi:hypothetical protein